MKKTKVWAICENGEPLITGFQAINSNTMKIITGQGLTEGSDDFECEITLATAKRMLKALQKAVNVMERSK